MSSTVLAGYGQGPEGHAPREGEPKACAGIRTGAHVIHLGANSVWGPLWRESDRATTSTEAEVTRESTWVRAGLAWVLVWGMLALAPSAALAVTASSRFASYVSGGDGVTASVNPPAGYSAGDLAATLASSVSVSSSLTMRNPTTSFQTFFQADGVTPSTVPSYVSLRSRGNTVTLTFSDPIPANSIALNLVDVDVERLTVRAAGPGNTVLTASELGFRDVYNGIGSNTDTPVWSDASATLTGRGVDTTGAAAWFSPTVEVESITVTSPSEANMTASSVVYLWLAAIRPVAVVTPTVTSTEITAPTVSLPLAVSTSGGALTHSVDSAGTAGCSLETTTLTTTSEGECLLTFSSAETAHYRSGTATFTFTVTADQPGSPDPVATVSPISTSTTLDDPVVRLPLAEATGGGTITHTVVDAGSAGCALGDEELVVSAEGTCTIQAISAPTNDYLSGSTSFTFTVTGPVAPGQSAETSNASAAPAPPEEKSLELAATGPRTVPPWSLWAIGIGLALALGGMRATLIRPQSRSAQSSAVDGAGH